MSFVHAVIVALAVAASAVEVDQQSEMRAGGMHRHDASLKSDMHRMMEDDDDDDITLRNTRKVGFLQVRDGKQASDAERSMAAYEEESARELSEALGPRWNAQTLEDDANRKTS